MKPILPALIVGMAAALQLQSAFPQASPEKTLAAPTPIADSLVSAATTQRSIRIGGDEIRYRGTWSEMVLEDEDGAAQATISATSYVREDVSAGAQRPVMFFFNGGPGASSSPLHFSAFGPRRRSTDENGEPVLVDNESSLIAEADLVFIDPVGTGFSRELKKGGGAAYWSLSGDPQAALSYIRKWLGERSRQASPVFVAGESFGGMRLALMAKDIDDLNVAGFILLSPVTDMSANASAQGNDLPYIFAFPSMAVAAWTHGKAGDSDGNVENVWEAARAFAQSDYAVALQQGDLLAAKERVKIAKRMSQFLALDEKTIEGADLRIGTQTFLESLLADENKLVGRLDTRIAAPKREKPINPDRPAAANDPALGLGKSNVIKSEFLADYFRDELNVETDREYYSLTLDVNFNFDWSSGETVGPAGARFYLNATPNIASLMEKKPAMRVLLVSGYYDLATPVLGQRYALTHGGLPMDRVDMIALPASHSPFDDDRSRMRLSGRIKGFIRDALVD